jgi:hypothetical protein
LYSIVIYAVVIESLIIRLLKSIRVSLTVHAANMEEISVKCGKPNLERDTT